MHPSVIPPLSLAQVLASKEASPGVCPAGDNQDGDSDRSCATQQASQAFKRLRLPTLATSDTSAATEPEPNTPHSDSQDANNNNASATSPQRIFRFDALSLSSPMSAGNTANNAAMRTPTGTPRVSPHSPKSPSMMSPIRMVGMRSPRSVRLTGNGSVLSTPRGSSPNGSPSKLAGSSPPAGGSPRVLMPPVQRLLPFSTPVKIPQAPISPLSSGASPVSPAAAGGLGRFHMPRARELSFRDFLDPQESAKLAEKEKAQAKLQAPPARLPKPPAASLPVVAAPPAPIPEKKSSSADEHDQLTPRKRPRKSTAPQRAGLGSYEVGSSSMNLEGLLGRPVSSLGERGSANYSAAVAMDEDQPGQASPIKRAAPFARRK